MHTTHQHVLSTRTGPTLVRPQVPHRWWCRLQCEKENHLKFWLEQNAVSLFHLDYLENTWVPKNLYTPCSCELNWRHRPAPVYMETWRNSRETDIEEKTWSSGRGKPKGKQMKCVLQIQTRWWRLLDLLLLEVLAFSVSAWNQDRESAGGSQWGAAENREVQEKLRKSTPNSFCMNRRLLQAQAANQTTSGLQTVSFHERNFSTKSDYYLIT